MKTVIKALLAASMLMPVAAQAQDGGDRREGRRGEWNQREHGPRADRPAPPPAGAVGVEAQVRSERPQPARQFQQNDRSEGRPNWRQDGRQGQPGQFEGRPDDRQARGYGRPGIDDRGLRPDGGRRDDRQPDYAQGNVRNRGDWRGNGGGRTWNDGRRSDDQGGWNRGGGNWNRGWRNDDRYDWNRYRQGNRSAYRLPRYYAPSGWSYGYRRFSVGVSLSSALFGRDYWIDDPYDYRLPEAYGPYRWVRYYGDALLVDIRSGRVVDTVYDIFG